MLITRWQAPIVPSLEQIKKMFLMEGLSPQIETYPANVEISEHRHPFDEIRVVHAGQLMVNVNGNKLLLRAGDRIVIPANTKHSTKTEGDNECVSLYAVRPF